MQPGGPGGVVTAVGGPAGLAEGGGVLDLGGRYVLRGLWDHHVHLDQWALARRRLDLSACRSAADCCAVVRRCVAEAPPPAGQPLIGQGYRDALWPDTPDLRAMDEAAGRVPVVLVGHDLHTGWLRTAAARRHRSRGLRDGRQRGQLGPPSGSGPARGAGLGLALMSPEKLHATLREARQCGLDCAVHAIGDRANTAALDGH